MVSEYMATLGAILMLAASFGQRDVPRQLAECRFVTAADLSDPKAPTFKSYPVTTRETVSSPKLDLTSNPIAKRYRTVLRREVGKGSNYAGHYRIAFWGCGTSCAMFAVVNLKTGRVITPHGFTTVSGVHLAADEFLPNTESDGWAFRYKSDSTLLVVVGALDENESRQGAFYFVLKGETLRQVHSTVVRKNSEEVKP